MNKRVLSLQCVFFLSLPVLSYFFMKKTAGLSSGGFSIYDYA
ncbi:hypothetical protein BAME_08320 [Bacillus sp. M 2-6]|nr:hypothetical protein BAME_08320 [Bacillus sp. M 2-6]